MILERGNLCAGRTVGLGSNDVRGSKERRDKILKLFPLCGVSNSSSIAATRWP